MNGIFTVSTFFKMEIWQVVVLALLLFFFSMLLIRIMFINKKTFGTILVGIITVLGFTVFLFYAKFEPRYQIIKIILIIVAYLMIPLVIFLLIQKDISKHFDTIMQVVFTKNKNRVVTTSSKTKEIIADAIFEMSSKKIGALITIEKYNALDQFSERAIPLNADVTKELLINIFIPNTPLHDGAVIIKNDKIICAGAYFNLTKNGSYEKTTGSRHRAAIGISEISDALTIIASEETGDVSITYGSVLLPMPDKDSLLNYLTSFAN